MSVKSPRFTVIELLNKMDNGAYSNLVLDSVLEGSSFSDRDKSFISRIFYGVIERKLTLEYVVSLYSNKPLQKLDSSIVNILKMGLYQLLYMDSVPDNAAVNESVTLAKQSGKSSAAGFVNAVLRNFIRDGKKIKFPENKIERLSIEYSCDPELTQKLVSDYSYDLAENLLKSSVTPHKTYLRVNNLKITADDLVKKFIASGVSAEICDITDNCVTVENLGGIEKNNLFLQGFFHVQDLSSQLCCKVLDPQPGETVLDVCAAPGGKSFTFTEMMNNNGRVISCDLHKNRVKLIESGAERLGISIIEAFQNDAKLFNEKIPLADKVLCDVPCSGFGVIRSKPEIKYTDLRDVKRLPEIQYEILSTASKYVKQGGELVYSTCTLNRDENDDVIDRFLSENSDFEPVNILENFKEVSQGYKATIFPAHFDCEGFFISKIRKVGI
ncbi:MAG: 16S rRNA (cytosine(967)-C(5))-methyltransferase RsmB [Oscillospiraceae bacterium]